MTRSMNRFPFPVLLRSSVLAGLLGVAAVQGAGASDKASAPSPAGALDELTSADIEAAHVPGELACGFSVDGGPLLLLARGDVASREEAWAIVKAGGAVTMLSAPGGFDAMIEAARFSGEGVTVSIRVTGKAEGGGEAPPNPATLSYEAAGKAEEIAGQWTCGP